MNPNKLKALREAGRINKAAIKYGFEIIKPQMTKLELDYEIGEFIVKQGGNPILLGYKGFPGNTCISINEEVVHGIPNYRQFRSGDLIKIDICTEVDGYCVDSAETRILKVPESILDYHLMIQTKLCLDETIKQLKPGMMLLEIAKIGDIIGELANPQVKFLTDYCGHGVGNTIHEDPLIYHSLQGISPEEKERISNYVLMVDQVLAIEPIGVLADHFYGLEIADDEWTVKLKPSEPQYAAPTAAHFEHTIIITEKGCEVLT